MAGGSTLRRPSRLSVGAYPGDRYVDALVERFGRQARPLADPPAGSGLAPVMGEPGPPGLGKTLTFMRHGPAVSLASYQRFGPVSWTRLFGMDTVLLVGAEACQAALVNKDKLFSQSGWEWFIGPFFRRGLMLLDGEEHHWHRHLMQEAFTRPRLEAYLQQLVPIIDERVCTWPTDEPFLLYPAFKELSLAVAAAVFMGAGPEERESAGTAAVARAFVDCVRAGLSLVRVPVPGLRWHRGLKGRAVLEDYFRSRIPAKRASDDQDLFAALCHVSTDEGHAFSDDDVVNHMIFLMMAAHDTSTITATTACYFLAKHPEWQERCRAESQAYGDGPIDLPGTEKLESLDLVFSEAMRLVTPVPGMARRTVEDADVLGHYVPAGTMVSVGGWASHLIPEVWADSDGFDPTRFEEPRREDRAHRYAYLPFGGGVHKCIGMHFRRAEVKALLHRLLLTYRVEVPAGYEVRWDMTALPTPADGLPVRLTPL
jgi:cytochrome P450